MRKKAAKGHQTADTHFVMIFINPFFCISALRLSQYQFHLSPQQSSLSKRRRKQASQPPGTDHRLRQPHPDQHDRRHQSTYVGFEGPGLGWGSSLTRRQSFLPQSTATHSHLYISHQKNKVKFDVKGVPTKEKAADVPYHYQGDVYMCVKYFSFGVTFSSRCEVQVDKIGVGIGPNI